VAAKRNRWFVGTVLTLILAGFLSIPILGSLAGRSANQGNPADNANDASSPDTQVESTVTSSEPTLQDLEGLKQAEAETLEKISEYEDFLQEDPENATARRRLNAALMDLIGLRQQIGEAENSPDTLSTVVEPLTKLVELNPQQTDYAVLLAQTKQEMGDFEGAAQVYRNLLDEQPGNLNALQGLSALFIQQKRPQAAIGLLQDTLETADTLSADSVPVNIDTISVKLMLAEIYYLEQGDVDRALAIYDEVIAESPGNFQPVLAKALVLKDQGQTDEANALFTQALAMAPAQYKDQIEQMATTNTTSDTDMPLTEPSDPNADSAPPAAEE
jgi:tetratricopeptide (TPR) repeat protein